MVSSASNDWDFGHSKGPRRNGVIAPKKTDLEGQQARGEIPWQELYDKELWVRWHVGSLSGHLERSGDT